MQRNFSMFFLNKSNYGSNLKKQNIQKEYDMIQFHINKFVLYETHI